MTDELRTAASDADNAGGPSAHVPSPCVSICAMDATNPLCTGCLRTIDEIAGWSRFSDDEKRAVWRRINERRKA
jgi:predicted Fe-S protein YdhL (DUF1289 family)